MPSGGLFLTAGADVQKDRIEVSIWAWGRGLESWLVDHLGAILDRTIQHIWLASIALTVAVVLIVT